jgi:tRNA modification GTPase
MTTNCDDIAALATARGQGALGVIRVSGGTCRKIYDAVFFQSVTAAAADFNRGQHPTDRLLRYGVFRDPASGQPIDDVLAVWFTGPRSFTGEDCFEIHCHGGSYVAERILGILLAGGCRPAQPGEFTRRAFLNGKIDLTTAEGIRGLSEAATHQQWATARQLASGQLRERISDLHRQILKALTLIEALVDFPDEYDIRSIVAGDVKNAIVRIRADLFALEQTFADGRISHSGLGVAIFGQPNAGKSTLMNCLLDRERALVSPIPGTTRDYLEEPCRISGRLIRLIDLAGIRETDDAIEAMGVARAYELARTADMVLVLLPADGSDADHERVLSIANTLNSKNVQVVWTKSDLRPTGLPPDPSWISVSAQRGIGVDVLRSRLVNAVDHSVRRCENELVVSDPRHVHCLQKARQSADEAIALTESGLEIELLAFEMRAAANHLGEMIGTISCDDVLDEVFTRFCIGK